MSIELLNVGDKLEMKATSRSMKKEDEYIQVRIYKSQIYDILADSKLKIAMPMKGQKLLLVPVGAEYEFLFFTSKGLYKANGKILGRYKNDNLFILDIGLLSNLVKHQRREYYRLETNIDTKYSKITENDIEQKSLQKVIDTNDKTQLSKAEVELLEIIESAKATKFIDTTGYIPGIIVDMSGGGVRMVSDDKLEVGDYIHFIFQIQRNYLTRECSFVGLVLYSEELPARAKQYEHRIKFSNMDKSEREMIIKYIFEEERKRRKNEKSW